MFDSGKILDYEVPFPKKGDKLFSSDGYRRHSACLNYSHVPWEAYTIGYKEAADILVQSIVERKGTPDTLVYPIVFLYRQYLELRLKDLYRDGCLLLDKKPNLKINHNLKTLWQAVRKIFEEVWPNGNMEQWEALDDLIQQFVVIDPGSFTFRYPTKKDGSQALDSAVRQINLRILSDVIDAMSTVLEGSAEEIAQALQFEWDMLSEIY